MSSHEEVEKDEIAAIGGQTGTGTNVFDNLLKEEPVIDFRFSGEEAFGRHLDLKLQELYNQYINTKVGEPIEYSAFLDTFSKPHKLSRRNKATRRYREYLKNLLHFLMDLFHRTKPLAVPDLNRTLSRVAEHVEYEWPKGTLLGWEDAVKVYTYGLDKNFIPCIPPVADLRMMSRESLVLCSAAHGLKVGGTPEQLIKRLLYISTPIIPLTLDVNKHQSGLYDKKVKEAALLEAKVKELCDLLDETIELTKRYVKKKQVMTYAEIESEREDQKYKLPKKKKNKKLKEFKCEICGNYTYLGLNAFEKHFMGEKHGRGMTRIGLPNSQTLHQITSIKEVRSLWEKIQERENSVQWSQDHEQFDDDDIEDVEGDIRGRGGHYDHRGGYFIVSNPRMM